MRRTRLSPRPSRDRRPPASPRIPSLLFGVALLPLTALLALSAALSVQWRVYHDVPILAYLGFLIERFGYVPFRDFFDMNLPGTYLVFAALGRTVGFSDLALRLADLAGLVAVLLATALALRPLGARSAAWASVLFGVLYLHEAPLHGLQRESMLLVPVSLALLALAPRGRNDAPRRAAIAGALLGVAATIKPSIAIDLVPVLAYAGTEAWKQTGSRRRAAGAVAAGVGAFAVPVAALFAYLAAAGALAPFLEMAVHYWPLYAKLGGVHEVIPDDRRLSQLVTGVRLMGGHGGWFVAAAVSAVLTLRFADLASSRRRFVWLILGLLLTHLIYPALGGQFWPYHWYPFLYSVACVVALAWVGPAPGAQRGLRWMAPAVAVVAALLMVRPSPALVRQLDGVPVDTPLRSRVEEIANYLEAHLRAGDTVQPLDWTGGAVHAMLIARARLATPFLYDFHFYHHVSTPYVQELRRRFMARLEAAPPRFVIRIETRKPWVQGEDTTRDFPELQRFLAARYAVGLAGDGYDVLVRSE